ncbi:PIG-L family deacetylase [Sphingobacterium paludis]|uniref:GlcNAc-PI de-N-acetylase n=1 Tax=Sphingobacterium paludis TaxID=1476465 RepID=A0A4R7D3U4_9SPHI|nr:PIG-L family deacetylase [Sphingobacterium paludis]TDS14801.1 GlcNAc-PI de-N-acetylase [Sphingobacterium paludis]
MSRHYIGILIATLYIQFSFAQAPTPRSSSEIRLNMERLNVLGSVLYFAAHPDDENTKLISYLASERQVRTSYLSLTRGDGGQNLIGTEQGIELGLIRTQELLQARKIDGGEQYFSSAYDFGFSKTYDETFQFWKKDEVLREAVWLIRKLQPDIIITRFPPDERGGHGHHQASAILAHEAFLAAADPAMFPEQLSDVSVWKAKRLLWNTASFMRMQGENKDQLKIDIGEFNPLLGKSHGEISALSRSQHKSQGFGSASSNGKFFETFEYVAGERAKKDLFDNVDLTWNRVEGGAAVKKEIDILLQGFDDKQPQRSIPQLATIWQSLQGLPDGYWKTRKITEVENLLLACAGIKLEAVTAMPRATRGSSIPFKAEIIARNPNVSAQIVSINGETLNKQLPANAYVTLDRATPNLESTQPYWLERPHSLGKFDVRPEDVGYPMNVDLPAAVIKLRISDVPITCIQPIQYRFVDPVRGEVNDYLEVVPKLSGSAEQPVLLIPKGEERTLDMTFQRHDAALQGSSIEIKGIPAGWEVFPQQFDIRFTEASNTLTQTIRVKNSSAAGEGTLDFFADGKLLEGIREIAYDHIPRQAWFPTVAVKIKPITIEKTVARVGYLMGAGDLVPEALRNLGIQVDILHAEKINAASLAQYDAIIGGVRLLNVNASIEKALPALYAYANNGGVVLMQYNVNSRLQVENFAAKPFTLSRARVTEEDAKVTFTDASDPALNYPNKITKQDFEGWVQERGLYFAENIDAAYRTPLRMADKNEPQHEGSLLICKVGNGKFVYTGLSFFRQLPAGVAGATRLFVNLLAKEN